MQLSELVALRTPGQIPTLDARIDRTHSNVPRHTLTAVAEIPSHVRRDIDGLLRSMSASTHEVEFRRGLMAHMLEQGYDAKLRRSVLAQALDQFRKARSASSLQPTLTLRQGSNLPNLGWDAGYTTSTERARGDEDLERSARGGKYHRRISKPDGKHVYVYNPSRYERRHDAHVDGRELQKRNLKDKLLKLLDKAGNDGCAPDHFAEHVQRHGAKTVAEVLREIDVDHSSGRIKRKTTQLVAKAEVMPVASSAGAGGGAPSPKKLPPGTRRVWHNRIVERMPDDKWHVVGHVAGLEDPHAVPQLHPNEIDPAHREELANKIRELIAEKKGGNHA